MIRIFVSPEKSVEFTQGESNFSGFLSILVAEGVESHHLYENGNVSESDLEFLVKAKEFLKLRATSSIELPNFAKLHVTTSDLRDSVHPTYARLVRIPPCPPVEFLAKHEKLVGLIQIAELLDIRELVQLGAASYATTLVGIKPEDLLERLQIPKDKAPTDGDLVAAFAENSPWLMGPLPSPLPSTLHEPSILEEAQRSLQSDGLLDRDNYIQEIQEAQSLTSDLTGPLVREEKEEEEEEDEEDELPSFSRPGTSKDGPLGVPKGLGGGLYQQ